MSDPAEKPVPINTWAGEITFTITMDADCRVFGNEDIPADTAEQAAEDALSDLRRVLLPLGIYAELEDWDLYISNHPKEGLDHE